VESITSGPEVLVWNNIASLVFNVMRCDSLRKSGAGYADLRKCPEKHGGGEETFS
jgi:hypothetical protein